MIDERTRVYEQACQEKRDAEAREEGRQLSDRGASICRKKTVSREMIKRCVCVKMRGEANKTETINVNGYGYDLPSTKAFTASMGQISALHVRHGKSSFAICVSCSFGLIIAVFLSVSGGRGGYFLFLSSRVNQIWA